MKKRTIAFILALLILAGAFTTYKIFGPGLSTANGEFFYIKTGSDYSDVKHELIEKKYINTGSWFDLTSKILKYKTAKAGRYKITKGMSVFSLVRMLKNGRQTSVNFVITKLRTKETLATRAGNMFECDSLEMISFLNNADSLKNYGLDTNTVMAAIMPYTYTLNWNSTAKKIFLQLYTAYKTFWTSERKQKAYSIHLSPLEVSILASILEEETNAKTDKPNIASVYLNRIKLGMPLQADPTVKFALRDFALKRIYSKHTQIVSPYNTYVNKGLPPGPICTPSIESIDAVLDSPKTDYLYFVANSDFSGTHIFTSNYEDHMKYARIYQQALNKQDSIKQAKK